MFHKTIALAAIVALPRAMADGSGYVLPDSGTASTSQFLVGPEFGGGTACGVTAMPSGQKTGGSGGQGSGQLYAAINQLAFGANPSGGAGGAGGACGLCYKITPVDGSGKALTANALTFMIVDECPADPSLSGSQLCGQCKVGDGNIPYNQNWHFDIAVDAMSQDQYSTFFNGVTDGKNWKATQFQQTACGGANNQKPALGQHGGCVSGSCGNNDKAQVCAGVNGDQDQGHPSSGSGSGNTTSGGQSGGGSGSGGSSSGGQSGGGSGSGGSSSGGQSGGSSGSGGSSSGDKPGNGGGGKGSGGSKPKPTPKAEPANAIEKAIIRRHAERELDLGITAQMLQEYHERDLEINPSRVQA